MGMGAGIGRGSGMTGKGPKGYTRSDDRIKEDVCDCLTDDHHVDATSVEVQVRNGEVTLSGTVDSREAKRRAEDLAERASGVKHVQNNLRILTGNDAGGSDADKRTGAGHTTSSIIT
ncbi:MAG: BON domain-containing protein [Enhydrobacter sp.]|nr:BON domain-containing protein [Enhydrobacter sp.]